MSTLTSAKPHTLTLPPDLFARIEEAARAQGQDPDTYALAALTATVEPPPWRAKLLRSQEKARQSFLACGMSDDELADDVEAEIRAYRSERRS